MNKLLELFEVKNHKELIEFIKNNPDDERVKEIQEIANLFNFDFSEVDDEA
ncbi:MAG: hypothetical protein ACTJGH_04575 [Peptoniphilaceae bacterium]